MCVMKFQISLVPRYHIVNIFDEVALFQLSTGLCYPMKDRELLYVLVRRN